MQSVAQLRDRGLEIAGGALSALVGGGVLVDGALRRRADVDLVEFRLGLGTSGQCRIERFLLAVDRSAHRCQGGIRCLGRSAHRGDLHVVRRNE